MTGRSVLLWFFCPKVLQISDGMILFHPQRLCGETVGVFLYMENRSHGVADGGRCGRPTSKRQFVVVSNCRSSFLRIWRAEAKSKVLPLLEQSIARENVFDRKRKSLRSRLAYREAVAAGLDSLSKDAGEDSSSQHSRELQRLFWAWLPEEDRDFLAASEGLGNSQKAEVAWLERKGYQYTQVDIIEFNQSSKRIISLEP